MDAEEAEYAKRRAAAQQKKEELRQVKVQAQIDEIKAKRKAEKAEKEQHNSVRALPERTMGGTRFIEVLLLPRSLPDRHQDRNGRIQVIARLRGGAVIGADHHPNATGHLLEHLTESLIDPRDAVPLGQGAPR